MELQAWVDWLYKYIAWIYILSLQPLAQLLTQAVLDRHKPKVS